MNVVIDTHVSYLYQRITYLAIVSLWWMTTNCNLSQKMLFKICLKFKRFALTIHTCGKTNFTIYFVRFLKSCIPDCSVLPLNIQLVMNSVSLCVTIIKFQATFWMVFCLYKIMFSDFADSFYKHF